jgi:hypothetical protein
VKLQALLDLTLQRILQAVGDPLGTIISKWGLNGSSARSDYKKKSAMPDLNDSIVGIHDHDESGAFESGDKNEVIYGRILKLLRHFTADPSSFSLQKGPLISSHKKMLQ